MLFSLHLHDPSPKFGSYIIAMLQRVQDRYSERTCYFLIFFSQVAMLIVILVIKITFIHCLKKVLANLIHKKKTAYFSGLSYAKKLST